MMQPNIIKKVTEAKGGQGSTYGRIYLPKEYAKKLVLIIPLNKSEEKRCLEDEEKYLKSLKKREEKLKIVHAKLLKIRKKRKSKVRCFNES